MSNEVADGTHELRPENSYNYDVFLSFNGEDTRRTFTGNLYNALRHKRIKTFFLHHNDEFELVENDNQLSPSILKTIQQSRISIVVFSQNYASSLRCLDELVNILECNRRNNKLVWPIFYDVDPSQVRFQSGPFQKDMHKLERRFHENLQRVEQWRAALSEVASLAGWRYGTGYYNHTIPYEYELIQKIVEAAVKSLPRYDIFLSFTGEDTRYSFTGFLYHALRRAGFITFMDDEGLEGGNQISQTLIKAIEKSRLSIVVFSENYAYSTWCLDELAKIMECRKTKNQLVWPIFYKVEKSDVSNQTKSYGDAMTAHENRFGKDSEKVQKWKLALSEAAFLEGEQVKEDEYEYEFIKKIVERAIDVENKTQGTLARAVETRTPNTLPEGA